MAMAIPAAISVGGMIASHYASKKAQANAMQQTPLEANAASSLSGMGDVLAKNGGELFRLGTPALGQALNYYSTLTGGNRAQMQEAVAPEAEQISETYGGAERGLARAGLRGAQRDQAVSELTRQKAGQISSLIGGVRNSAASTLAGIGGTALSAASGANSSATGAYGSLIGGEAARRTAGQNAADATSAQFGSLVADLLKNYGSKSAGAGGGNK